MLFLLVQCASSAIPQDATIPFNFCICFHCYFMGLKWQTDYIFCEEWQLCEYYAEWRSKLEKMSDWLYFLLCHISRYWLKHEQKLGQRAAAGLLCYACTSPMVSCLVASSQGVCWTILLAFHLSLSNFYTFNLLGFWFRFFFLLYPCWRTQPCILGSFWQTNVIV